jgi:hypothetical protein
MLLSAQKPKYTMASKTGFTIDSEVNSKQSFETPTNDEIQSGEIEKTTDDGAFKGWLKKLSVETGGIQRVTDEDRAKNTSKVWNACTFWYAYPFTTPLYTLHDLARVRTY